jgi:Zn-dependent M28 family amino/carboxypeptidase
MLFRLLFIALVLTCSTAHGQTAAELRTHVEYLASDELGGRLPASEGMEKAIKYVMDGATKLGLTVYTQDVKVKGDKPCQNVIAVLEGVDTSKRIVIGAHLDHIGMSPGRRLLVDKPVINNGADDNATGSAAVLALARVLSATQPPCTIEFHWYTGEEQGLLGSKTYVKKPIGPIDSYRFMLNFDMIGRLKKQMLLGDRPPVKQPFDLDAVLDPLYERHIFAKRITWAADTGDSDHASWWKGGVQAVILHTGLHSDYHKPTDTSDKIYFEGMAKVCDYGLDIVAGVYQELGLTVVPVDEPTDEDVPFILY